MEKKNKNKKLYVIIISLLIIIGIGGIVYNIKISTERERQIEFLKSHEKEMTEYIKSQNSKIKTVEYDWNSVEKGKIGNGTPQGGGEVINVFGYVNKERDIDFSLSVELDIENEGKIKSIFFGSSPDFDKGGN